MYNFNAIRLGLFLPGNIDYSGKIIPCKQNSTVQIDSCFMLYQYSILFPGIIFLENVQENSLYNTYN